MVERSLDFNQRLAELCRAALMQGADFAKLLDRVEGADPRAVLDCLYTLTSSDPQLAVLARNASEEGRSPTISRGCSTLPIVHPLDYHWRFAPETITTMLDRLAVCTAPGETVAFLGTPSLYAECAERLPGRKCVLFDSDIRVVDALGGDARVIDLTLDDPPRISASCAVADPPWYPEAIHAFARAAGTVLSPGGTFLLGFPAPLTRPGVNAERGEILRALQLQGLRLLNRHPLLLRYETPPFEQAAMAAAGVSAPGQWRRGDLLTFDLSERFAPGPRALPIDPHWSAFELAQIPIRVNPDAPALGSDLIGSLVPGDLLSTVSRRDPIRPRVALWTSRNRVFSSSNPVHLLELVERVQADLEPRSPAERIASERLTALVRLEREEHGFPTAEAALLA
jgi:Probable N6-adenine methyltransferase